MTNTAWTDLEAFMQRNEFLIDREYVNACRHYASQYEEHGAFEVWRNATSRYAVCMQELGRMTGRLDDLPGPHGIIDEHYLRSGLIHLAERIPLYAMLRTGNSGAVEALLAMNPAPEQSQPMVRSMISC